MPKYRMMGISQKQWSIDGYKLHQSPTGQWTFVEGRRPRLLLTGSESRKINECFRRRGLTSKRSAIAVPNPF